jgi:hypothetical protein
LAHVPRGSADLVLDAATNKLGLRLKLTGLSPDSTHQVDLRAGSCSAADGGAMVLALPRVTADARGLVTKSLIVDGPVDATTGTAITTIPSRTWHAEVHTGAVLRSPEEARRLLCGDITNGGSAAVAAMKPLQGPGDDVTGTARITLDRSTRRLTVKLTARGLDPGSSHTTALEHGSCSAWGSVKYALTSLAADAAGGAISETTVEGVEAVDYGSWYLSVYQDGKGEPSTPPGHVPAACGDVVRR